jgi:hypothetical protein
MPDEHNNELETLRRTNGELITKNASRKQRITELEKTIATLEIKLSDSTKQVHELTIGAPMKHLAESISNVPELFIEQLNKHFKVVSEEDSLVLQMPDGKPAKTKDGKPVEWKLDELRTFLIDADKPYGKVFQTLIIGSRGSGAAGGKAHTVSNVKQKEPDFKFGLR